MAVIMAVIMAMITAVVMNSEDVFYSVIMAVKMVFKCACCFFRSLRCVNLKN